MWHNLIFPVIFWSSVALLFYTFLGYPIVIYFLGRFISRNSLEAATETLPTATIVLAAFNEEDRIERRLLNLLETQYPSNRLDIVLVSDGSTDFTVERARSLKDLRIQIVVLPKRTGKAGCLNAGLAIAAGEIIVFADVRQRFTPETIPHLIKHFCDPQIGAVSGSLEIDSSTSAVGGGVDAYWKLEKFIRYYESRFDSSIGCTGAIYAIRRNLYRPLPVDTLLDDVVTPMEIAARGGRVLFDPFALAFDPQSLEPEREWIRKRRTLAGNYQMLFRYLSWMFPWKNRLWWQLISHKYLRLAAPWFLLVAFTVNAALLKEPFYRGVFVLQCFFYLLALAGGLLRGKKNMLVAVPAGFVFLNITAMLGLWHYFRRSQESGWQTTPVKEQTRYV
jgi:cellulose synthase/poly-beta-1,6-N-acetylglucosamine synthase-like glycosyltransferase